MRPHRYKQGRVRDFLLTAEYQGQLVNVEGAVELEKTKLAFCSYQSKDWIREELLIDSKSRGKF